VYTAAQVLTFQLRLPRGIRPPGMLGGCLPLLAVPAGNGVPRTSRHLALDVGSFNSG
jgi:hypothetical protein